jgi:hypothetical protein
MRADYQFAADIDYQQSPHLHLELPAACLCNLTPALYFLLEIARHKWESVPELPHTHTPASKDGHNVQSQKLSR